MRVLATLIEVDHLVPERLWYARYGGRQFWCQAQQELISSEGWLLLPGQGVSGVEAEHAIIFEEHAWQLRQGVVALVLVEVEAAVSGGEGAALAKYARDERPWAQPAGGRGGPGGE